MSSTGLPSFEEALARVPGKNKPHVLLGNGFSQACRADIFSYNALFERADFSKLSADARGAFDALGTTDFEEVMRALRASAALVELYSEQDSGSAVRLRMEADADGLREVLVNAIASSHPGHPGEISDESYALCRAFLKNFDRVFTLNYDLLLYWALMHDRESKELKCDDGFRAEDNPDEPYVTWNTSGSLKQNIYYLHGALHIFDSGTEIQKYTWSRTGVRLLEQIREALENNLYPLFVAEGESSKKLERIRHSDFLSKASRSFHQIGGSLFIHGHSLDPNDQHILDLIVKNKVRNLFVSVHGDPESERAKQKAARVQALSHRRPDFRPLEILYYDASTASIWEPAS